MMSQHMQILNEKIGGQVMIDSSDDYDKLNNYCLIPFLSDSSCSSAEWITSDVLHHLLLDHVDEQLDEIDSSHETVHSESDPKSSLGQIENMENYDKFLRPCASLPISELSFDEPRNKNFASTLDDLMPRKFLTASDFEPFAIKLPREFELHPQLNNLHYKTFVADYKRNIEFSYSGCTNEMDEYVSHFLSIVLSINILAYFAFICLKEANLKANTSNMNDELFSQYDDNVDENISESINENIAENISQDTSEEWRELSTPKILLKTAIHFPVEVAEEFKSIYYQSRLIYSNEDYINLKCHSDLGTNIIPPEFCCQKHAITKVLDDNMSKALLEICSTGSADETPFFVPDILVYPAHKRSKEGTRKPSTIEMKNKSGKVERSFDNNENMAEEWHRLLTYKNWPKTAMQFPIKLAQAGFYYSGNEDEVICFSCNGCVKQWNYLMLPNVVHRQLFPSCAFVISTNSSSVNVDPPATTSTDDQRSKMEEALNVPVTVKQNKFKRDQMKASGTSLPRNTSNETLPHHSDPGQFGKHFNQSIQDRIHSAPDQTLLAALFKNQSSLITSRSSDEKHRSSTVPPRPPPDDALFKRMENLNERLETFKNWAINDIVSGQRLAEAGLFYQGISDRVQCAWCRGVLHKWKEGDEPKVEHHKFYPHCYFVRHDEFSSVKLIHPAVESGDSTMPKLSAETDLPVTGVPKHPKYASINAREQSFVGWPSQLSQTASILANAGFFYVGFGDCVKCFMCNGGLRNWASTDVPWEEHAQWFPECEYVKKYRRSPAANPQNKNEGAAARLITAGTSSSNISAEDAAEISRITESIEEMGYSRASIQEAINTFLRSSNPGTLTVTRVLDMFMENTEPKQIATEPQLPQTSEAKVDEKSADEEEKEEKFDPRSLLEENRSLKEKSVCKICMERSVSVVFVPCGHLVCCQECATQLRLCPICRARITKLVKTYFS